MTRSLRLSFLALILVAALVPVARSQNISTLAGGGGATSGAAASIPIAAAQGISRTDSAGNYFIASPSRSEVFQVNASGQISVFAGTGTPGFSGDGGAAGSAELYYPYSVTLDGSGNLYIAEYFNSIIRVVNRQSTAITINGTMIPPGSIQTVAGTPGVYSYGGDGGLATSAKLEFPEGVALDSAGNIYIADSSNDRIRVVNTQSTSITFYSGVNLITIPPGDIQTIAGGSLTGNCNANGDGGTPTGAYVCFADAVTLDSTGNVYISDGSGRIRVINTHSAAITIGKVTIAAGTIATVAGTGTGGFSGDGGSAASAELQGFVGDVAFDSAGNFYIADTANNRIRAVNTQAGTITINGVSIPHGDIQTVVGNGTSGFSGDSGSATSAELHGPIGLAFDNSGNLLIGEDGNNRVRKVTSGGTITTVAGNGYYNYNGNGLPAASTNLYQPANVAIDKNGNVFIADGGNNSIFEVVAATGQITAVAGSGAQGFAGDGGPATSAQFFEPYGVAVDSAGDVFISDFNNQRIRKVKAGTGIITTIAGGGTAAACAKGVATAASLDGPYGLAVDSSGNVYIADIYNNCVQVVNTQTTSITIQGVTIPVGDIATIAGNGTQGYTGDGGAATSAEVSQPYDVAVDSSNNVYIADEGNQVIRKITGGIISTVPGSSGGALSAPFGVAVDSSGSLYVANAGNNTITKLAAGVATTIAGDGSFGYNGDGIPATTAWLAQPEGVAVDSLGDVFIGDYRNERVREVAAIQSTSTSLTSTVNPSSFGQSVTFKATVTAGSGTPTGTATFYDAVALATCASPGGSLQLGSTQTLSAGIASVSTSNLSVASHTILACYTPSGNFAASGSSLTQTVNQASQTINITQNAPANAFFNGSFTVIATGGASGNSIVFATVAGSVCSITGTTATSATVLMTSGTGTCQLTLNQSGNGSYTAAPQLSTTKTNAAPLGQTINITQNAPATAAYNSSFTVIATGGASGNSIVFAKVAGGVCNISGTTATSATVLMTSGTGTCQLTLNQVGNINYSAATQVTTTQTQATALPTPFISEVSPIAVAPGGGSFALTVEGTGFVNGQSALDWNGSALASTACTPAASPALASCSATVPLGDIAAIGTASITVVNPATTPQTGTSNVVFLPITTSTPAIAFNSATVTLGTNTSPRGMAVGDFNGDGKLDVAIANANTNNVSILLGNGDGTFTAGTPLTAGTAPFAVAVGDFNGDGKLDLAVANEDSTSVSIFLGNGNGTFALKSTPTAGSFPWSIAAADFNGDGKLDLAVTNSSGNNVTILLGNGDGTFTATAVSPSTGSGPEGIVAGDFNGDGIPDLAVANAGTTSHNVTILIGKGDGTFTAEAISPNTTSGGGPAAITAADLNGDGKLDLVVANQGSINGLTVLMGNGDGTFTPVTAPATGTFPISVIAGDFTGDGNIDLAVANSATAGSVTVLRGDGTGSFTQAGTGVAGNAPGYLVAGDFNGDGRLDLVVSNHGVNSVSILLQTGNLTVTNTDDTGGAATLPSGWHWTISATNALGGADTFTSGQTLITDNLPNANIGYGAVSVINLNGVSGTGTIGCAIDGSDNLTCTASGGTVTLAPGATFGMTFSATPTSAGTFANPRTAGVCSIDPNNVIAESNEAGNTCSDTVIVSSSGTTTGVVTSQSPSTFGQSVTFTATVTVQTGTPTGSVTFYDATAGASCAVPGASIQIGAAQTLAGGIGAVSTTTLNAAVHTILACYIPTGIFSASSGTASQTVDTATQAISITQDAPATEPYNGNFTLTATGGASGQNIVFATVAGSVCSITGTTPTSATVTMTSGSGTCQLTLNQAGTGNFGAAPQAMSAVTVAQLASQTTLAVTGPGSVTYGTTGTATASGGSGTGALSFSAGSSTGCSVSGTAVSVSSATGTCALTATMGSDSNYSAATSVAFPVSLLKANQVIAITQDAPSTAAYQASFTVIANGGGSTQSIVFALAGGSVCSITGSTANSATVTMASGTGTCQLTLNQVGDNNYADAMQVSTAVTTAQKINQSALTVTGPSIVTYGAPKAASANGGSSTGLLSFSVGSSTGCSITGTTVSVALATGTCSLTATMAADNNYNPATSLPLAVTLVPATLTITPDGGKTVAYNNTFTAFTGVVNGLVSPDAATVSYISPGAAAGAPVGSYNITVEKVTFSTGLQQNYSVTENVAVNGLSVEPAPASQLSFTTAPFVVTAGQCSPAITVTSMDVYGNVSNVLAGTSVVLSSSSSADEFYSDSLCTVPVTGVTIAGGTSSATFYYEDTKAGTPTITAASLLTSPTQQETVNPAAPSQLVFANSPFAILAGQCSASLTVNSEDQFGNISSVAGSTQLDLTTASANGKFYTDAACQNRILPVAGTTFVTIASGSSAGFYYADLAPNTLANQTTSITATDDNSGAGSLGNVAQPETILHLAFTTSPFLVAQNQCSGQVTLTAENYNNQATPVTLAALLGLTSNSAGGAFYSDTACANLITPSGLPLSSGVTLAASTSGVSFSYEDTAAVGPTLTAAIGGYFVSQQETVGDAPAITSANNTIFTVNSSGTFTVHTTGSPTAALSEIGSLPNGVTFVDNHDGTATLSGTPALGTVNTYLITIGATNGIAPDASQGLTLTVQQASQTITITQDAPATAAYDSSFTVVATGGASTQGIVFALVSGSVCSITGTTATSATVLMNSGTGTCQLTVNQNGDSNYTAAAQKSTAQTTAQLEIQAALTVTGPSSVAFGTTGTATATGGSGTGTLSFSAGSSTGCSVVGTTVSVLNASGTCSLTATMGADNNYNSTTSASFTVSLVKAAQATLTVTAPAGVTYGTTGTATAIGGSGTGLLSFSAGSSTGCSVVGTTVSVLNASGTCSLTATMGGDNNYNSATSASFTVSLGKANQATLTVTGPTSVATGNTGTATATGGSGTGALSFSAGASTGCSVTGTTVNVINAAGTCSLTATMGTDNNYNSTTSAPFTVSLGKANQATLTVTGPSSVTYGTTGTATATGGSGTGTLSFSAGSSTGCSVVGATVSVLNASGTCSLTATMGADNNYNSTTSASFTVSLVKAAQATLTVTAPASVTYGTTGTATATGGTGTGLLSFSAGSSTGCSVVGTTVSVLNASGTCSLTATMGADNNYNSATSASFTVSLVKAAQATLTVTAPASVTYGTTGTATAAGGSGTGLLSFSAAGSTGCSVTGTTVGVTLATGTCSLTATRAADNNYNSITSAPFAVSLVKATPTITFGTAPAASYPGSFTVSASTNSDGALSYSYVSGQCTQSGTSSTFTTTATGACTVKASTPATSNFLAGSNTQIVTISGSTVSATTTTLTSSANPILNTQSVTFTATVTSTGGTPTGSVTFYDGSSILHAVSLSGGVASYTTTLSAGTHSIKAVYAGTASFTGSPSAILSEVVLSKKVSTATQISSSDNTTYVGQSVTFTAKVTSASYGPPTGSVTFLSGSTVLATVPLDATGKATLTTTALPASTFSITAQYAGAGIFAASSDSLQQDVDLYPTSTVLTTSLNPATFGGPSVTLSVTVTSPSGPGAGKVTLRDGLSVLTTLTLDSTGKAIWTTGGFSGGLHLLTATFNGNSTQSFSISNIVTQIVNPASTTTKVVSSLNPSTSGQKITFTATVTSSAGTPGGAIVFTDGSNSLGSASLNSSGQASLSTTSLRSGTHSITASYAPNTLNYQAGSAGLSQVVH